MSRLSDVRCGAGEKLTGSRNLSNRVPQPNSIGPTLKSPQTPAPY